MKPEEVIQIFRETGALLEGHFRYASGRHGSQFLQASRVLQHPARTEALCKSMAERYREDEIQLVVGPATGGIILAYETARHLNCRAVFTEKDGGGGFALKRGFALRKGTKVLVVEDIITTGRSVLKTIEHLRGRGADIAGIAVLIDRSAGKAQFVQRFEPLASMNMQSWDPENCDLCEKGRPLVEPDDLIV